MKSILHSSIALALLTAVNVTPSVHAADIERSKITEVVKTATVLQTATKSRKPARVNEIFGVPDVLRTGPDSRVEMVAEDETVTRVGANTIFSFEPQKREINLQQGSVLFNSPTGKGGGTIRTAAATAAVQGTTLIVVTTKNGGFKVLLLEGRGRVQSENGESRRIAAGQMVYALPGGSLSGVLNFQLGDQVGASRLVGGFKKPLPSKAKIEQAITKQNAQIAKGQLVTTGLLASESPTQAYRVDNTIALDVVRSPERAEFAQPITNSTEAGLADAVIAAPTLQTDRVFSALTDAPPFLGDGGVAQDLPPDYSLYVARNTTVRTPTIDLSPYPGTFVFYSAGDFIVEQSVRIGGASDTVGVFTLGTLKLAPGVFLDIDADDAAVFALGQSVSTDAGAILGSPISLVGGGLRSSGNLSVFGSSLDLDRSVVLGLGEGVIMTMSGDINAIGLGTNSPQFVAPQAVSLFAGNNIAISRSFFSTQNALLRAENDLTLDTVAFTTANGPALSTNLRAANNMDLSTVAFRSRNVTLEAQNMRLTQVGFFPGQNFQGNASLISTGAMALTGVNFQSQNVSLEARTMALTGVAFPAQSNVTLRSQTGLLAPRPNTGQPVELGKVNFIQNVTYGGQPAQNFIDRGITITK